MSSYREFLLARMSGVGGSDVSAIVGKSDYGSPLTVFKDKKVEPEEEGEPDHREWGKRLEPVIGQWYEDFNDRGRTLEECGELIRHAENTWMIANIDRWVHCPEKGKGVAEIKNVSAFKQSEWREGPPVHYFLQLQHYLHVTGCAWGVFIVFMGNQCKWVDVDADPKIIARIVEATGEFWEMVESDTAPTADGHKAAKEAIDALYPPDERGAAVALPLEAVAWDGDMLDAKKQIKELEKVIEDRSNKIRQAIGTNERGILEGEQVAYSNKPNKNGVRTLRREDKS